MGVSILRDLPNTGLVMEAVTTRTVTTTTTGAYVDALTGDGRCVLFCPVAATSLTAITVQVQQSTLTNSGFADISGAYVSATTHGATLVSFDRDKRYLQTVVVLNGTTASLSATIFEQKKTF